MRNTIQELEQERKEKERIAYGGEKTRSFMPDAYSTKEYLADFGQLLVTNNLILNEINQNLIYLIQMMIEEKEEKQPLSEKERLVRTIGAR